MREAYHSRDFCVIVEYLPDIGTFYWYDNAFDAVRLADRARREFPTRVIFVCGPEGVWRI